MPRSLLALSILAIACTDVGVKIDEEDTGGSEETVDTADTAAVDYSYFDGATLRILTPHSADFLAIEESHHFEVELLDAASEPLEFDEVTWTSSADPSWAPVGRSFDDNTLDVGVHDITAEAALPNGDRLAHTVGGILVQSRYAGTYSGLFSSNVDLTSLIGFVVPCAGSVLVVVEPLGEELTGEATCVTSVQGFDMTMSYLFDLQNDEGLLDGKVAADIGGLFAWDVPASGTLDPEGSGLQIDFGGDAVVATVDGSAEAVRLSLDAGQ